MATELFTLNEASTTVSSGGTTAPAPGTSETWTVASSALFGAAVTGVSQFHVTDPALPGEIVAVTNVSGTSWTVTRGAESTTPAAHTGGFTIQQVITAGFLGLLAVRVLNPTAVKTTTCTASPGDLVVCDTTSGSFTVTLPNAPADMTTVGVKDVTMGTGNSVTVATAGSDVLDKTGGSTSTSMPLQGQAKTLQYKASGGIWYTLSGDLPLSQLDNRYVRTPNYGGLFGDGSDGAVAFDGTTTFAGFATTTGSPPNLSYTLTRDIFATTCTVSSGITVNTGDFRIFCAAGAFTLNGTLTRTGPAASGATAGAGTGGGTLQGGLAGAAGGTTAGANGSKGSATAGCGSGGAGGTSGASGGNHAGGSTRAPIFATTFPFRVPSSCLAGIPSGQQLPAVQAPSGGCGGSAGGGDGTNSGGGGGSGGGLIVVFAWSVNLASGSTVNVSGGNGGNAATGNCGGGGGGGGGLLVAYTLSAWTSAGTITVSGGAGGTAIGTGVAGTAGTAGTSLNVVVA